MALGGSTNSVLHLKAVAAEAGIDFPLEKINDISKKTPTLCHLRPAGDYHVEDLDLAGGISALMAELGDLLHLDSPTVSGKSLGQVISGKHSLNFDVIRPVSNPYLSSGGIAILLVTWHLKGQWSKSQPWPQKCFAMRGRPGSLTLKKRRHSVL